MKIIVRDLTIAIIFVFTCFSWMNGQSKFEVGIGIGINHSTIDDDFRTSAGPMADINKLIRFPAIFSRLGYKYSDRFHLNSGIGFSWLGALRRDQTARTIASTLELPLQIEWNATQSFHLSSGVAYNYITDIESETDQSKFDLLASVDSRHQFGLKHGIAYSHKLVELSLSFTHYLTYLFKEPIEVNGVEVGTYVSKFRNIQLGVLIRG